MVLEYISNEAKRFKVFVVNRIQLIREKSNVNQWRYIETKKNSADYTSCSLTPYYSKKMKSWISGSKFLWEEELKWPNWEDQVPDIANKDWDVKTTVSINVVMIENDILPNMVEQVSSWKKLLRVMVFVIKFLKRMKKISADGNISNILTVEDIRLAEVIVLQNYQKAEVKKAYKNLNGKGDQSKKIEENIGWLNPYLDEKGLIKIGGRLTHSGLEESVKHPILLPKKGHVTNLIIRWCHEKTVHSGRNMALTEIRSFGYWVIQGILS